jgi:hypothetical protein
MFHPLSARNTKDTRFDGPEQGLPDYFLASICEWLSARFAVQEPYGVTTIDGNLLRTVQVVLRMDPPLDWRNGTEGAFSSLLGHVYGDREFALDLLDLLVSFCDDTAAAALNAMLTMGGSEWEVTNIGGPERSLTKRTLGPVGDVIDQLRPVSERAHAHLTISWSKLAGRNPDPSASYREAVKAIEAVAKPAVLPNDDLATLGKVIGELRANPSRWQFVLEPDGAGGIADMCDLVWKGQLDRHGTDNADAPLQVSQREADAAFHIALCLVRIFAGGLITRA